MSSQVSRIKTLQLEFSKFIKFFLQELKPKGKILTPFNIISGIIILTGAIIIVIRFVKGLGAVTNLSQEFPWGFWISFDLFCGVALAAGAFVVAAAVDIFGGKTMKPLLRPPSGPEFRLDTISASHYVEKVRWCMDRLGLDYEEVPDVGALGVFTAGRTVPRLRIRTGSVISSIGSYCARSSTQTMCLKSTISRPISSWCSRKRSCAS